MMEEHQTCLSQDGDVSNGVEHPAVCIQDREEETSALCLKEDSLSVNERCTEYTVSTSPCIKEEPHWHDLGHPSHTFDYIAVAIKEEPALCNENVLPPSIQEEPISPKESLSHRAESTLTAHPQYTSDYVKEELSESDGTNTSVIEEEPDSHDDQNMATPKGDPAADHPSVIQANAASLVSEIEVVYQNPPTSTFGDIANLTRYRRAHSKRKTPQCSVCGKYFLRRAQLVAHEITHPEQLTVNCSKCSQVFPSTADFLAHKKTHRPETVFLCLECGRCFRGRGHLVLHQKIHRREKAVANV